MLRLSARSHPGPDNTRCRGHPLDADMNATVRTLVVISLFAALTAMVLDQGFLAAIFVAELAFALVEAIRRSR